MRSVYITTLLALLLLPTLAMASQPRRMTSVAEVGHGSFSLGVTGLGGIDPGMQDLNEAASGMIVTFGYGRSSRVRLGGDIGMTRGNDEYGATGTDEPFRVNGFAVRGKLQQNLLSAGPFLLDYGVDSGLSTVWASPVDRYMATANNESATPSAFHINNSIGLVTGFVFDKIFTAILIKAGAHQRLTLNTFEFQLFPTAQLHLEWCVPLGNHFSLNPHLGLSTFLYTPDAGVRTANGNLHGGISILRVR
jgi:hypothetical protein